MPPSPRPCRSWREVKARDRIVRADGKGRDLRKPTFFLENPGTAPDLQECQAAYALTCGVTQRDTPDEESGTR
jgi:hypothetical protein